MTNYELALSEPRVEGESQKAWLDRVAEKHGKNKDTFLRSFHRSKKSKKGKRFKSIQNPKGNHQ